MSHQKHAILQTAWQDRLSYLWLALGILFFALATFRWTIPLAAWLSPVFLLRFVRTQPLWRGFLLLLLAGVLVAEVELRGVLPFSGIIYYIAVFAAVLAGFLPYLLDRALARRLGGLLGTLVFPLAVTIVSYLLALTNPSTGSWGNLAYTQYGDLPLMQLVSVTGLWGIDFLIGWFASLINWAWEHDFVWPRIRGGMGLYGSVLALVLLFGGARLAFFPAPSGTVRVAGITPSSALIAAASKQTTLNMDALMSGKETPAQRQLIRQASTPVFDELFTLSEAEARAGAKVILWPECSGGVTLLQEDTQGLLTRASTLARTTGTYLDLGLCEMLTQPTPSRLMFDETILIDPQGSIVWRYQKAHPVPGEPFPAGDGKVPAVKTPYGLLSNVICFDADFPDTLRQGGQMGTDIMLVPGNDWQEIDPYHTHMATFRAIENGYSLVRQSSHGLSMTVDYEGHVLGTSDYFTSDPQVMVTYVPMQGVRTIYATIGDLFAWLSIAGLVALIAWALTRRPKASEEETVVPPVLDVAKI